MRRTVAGCALVVGVLAGCGTSSRASDQSPTIVTATPSHRDHAPDYASCEDFSEVFDSRDENQLSYLPERHWLIVSPSSTTYKIDLVRDRGCIEANPDLARFVAQFISQQMMDQRSECRSARHELETGDFVSGEKTVDPEALRTYALSVCRPLGIEVPRR